MHHLEDILIFQNILESIEEPDDGGGNPGRLLTEVGRYFLDAPYAGQILEQEGPESLIINLRAFDCFTYVENCLTISLMIPSRKRSWNDFTALLTRIRYRNGLLEGYASRLHYFSDWLMNNARKEILQHMTQDLGGISYIKNIDYMTKNPHLYPPLSDPAIARQIEEVEHELTDQPVYYIPTAAFDQQECRIKDGDIIGITSATAGLDVLHAGLAIRQGNDDALHLLHASEQAGKVIISEETLGDYLRANEVRTGVMVGRIRKGTR